MVRPAGRDRTAVEKRVTVPNGKGPTTPPWGATRESTGIIRRQRVWEETVGKILYCGFCRKQAGQEGLGPNPLFWIVSGRLCPRLSDAQAWVVKTGMVAPHGDSLREEVGGLALDWVICVCRCPGRWVVYLQELASSGRGSLPRVSKDIKMKRHD